MQSTPRDELRRWRTLATEALPAFGLRGASLSLLKCGENITYRVRRRRSEDTLLRIHRPIYHTAAQVRSELEWLLALRGAREMPVPEPLATKSGELLAVSGSHVCTLLRWMPGRQRFKGLGRAHMRALGETTARLHEHALAWKRPAGFDRARMDWKGLLSRDSNWGKLPSDVPGLFAEEDRPAVRDALQRIRAAMRTLDRLNGARALIHADLHFGNIVFRSGQACPIDFDDSGFGYLVYDLATSLIPYRESPRWAELRDGLLEGYRDVRPMPREQLELLPEFLAARGLTMLLWLTMRQPIIPRLPRDLSPYMKRTAAHCRALPDEQERRKITGE